MGRGKRLQRQNTQILDCSQLMGEELGWGWLLPDCSWCKWVRDRSVCDRRVGQGHHGGHAQPSPPSRTPQVEICSVRLTVWFKSQSGLLQVCESLISTKSQCLLSISSCHIHKKWCPLPPSVQIRVSTGVLVWTNVKLQFVYTAYIVLLVETGLLHSLTGPQITATATGLRHTQDSVLQRHTSQAHMRSASQCNCLKCLI